MRMSLVFGAVGSFVLFGNFCVGAPVSNGLAPEVTDLNAEDVSFALEKNIPYLNKPYS